MKAKNCTFEGKSRGAESAACAALLTFAVFAILPVSMAVTRGNSADIQLTRVFSYSESLSEEQAQASGGGSVVALAPSSASAQKAAAVSFGDIDFSKISVAKIGAFSLGSSDGAKNFSIAAFASGLGDSVGSGGFEIKTFEISALDKMPRRLNEISAQYPPQLLRRGIEGEVKLSVMIDENGRVEVLSVESSTDELFSEAAVRAAAKLLYEAPTKNGQPARTKFIMPIPFKIQK